MHAKQLYMISNGDFIFQLTAPQGSSAGDIKCAALRMLDAIPMLKGDPAIARQKIHSGIVTDCEMIGV